MSFVLVSNLQYVVRYIRRPTILTTEPTTTFVLLTSHDRIVQVRGQSESTNDLVSHILGKILQILNEAVSSCKRRMILSSIFNTYCNISELTAGFSPKKGA